MEQIHRWRIEMPPEEDVQAYLDLGWIKIKDLLGEGLRWSYGRGTPVFPGAKPDEPSS